MNHCEQNHNLTYMTKKTFYEKVVLNQQEVKELTEELVRLPRGRSFHNWHIMTTFNLFVLSENTLSAKKIILLVVILLTVIAMICHARYS